MSGLDYLLHPDGLTSETYCNSYPCIRITNIFDPDAEDVTTIWSGSCSGTKL